VSLPGAARSAARKPAAGQDAARLLSGLVALLHDGAPAEAFAACLDEAKALPHEGAAASALVEAVHMAMAVRNRLELQHERERGLLAVIESAQDLSSHLDLTGLLSAIVARARNLLGSDLGWLSVHDAQRGEFHVVVADGALAQATGGSPAVAVYGGEVESAGRVELLTFLREQAVSICAHRFGTPRRYDVPAAAGA